MSLIDGRMLCSWQLNWFTYFSAALITFFSRPSSSFSSSPSPFSHMGFHAHLYPRPIVPNTHDPSAVDFRAFYPYTPNEVKHRKRTTTQQLKVLEAVFKRDTKPNAQLRQDLASELNMTARGVQVRLYPFFTFKSIHSFFACDRFGFKIGSVPSFSIISFIFLTQ